MAYSLSDLLKFDRLKEGCSSNGYRFHRKRSLKKNKKPEARMGRRKN